MDTLAQLGVGLGALFVLWKLIAPVTEAHIATLASVRESMGAAVDVLDAIRKSIREDRELAEQRHAEIMERLPGGK